MRAWFRDKGALQIAPNRLQSKGFLVSYRVSNEDPLENASLVSARLPSPGRPPDLQWQSFETHERRVGERRGNAINWYDGKGSPTRRAGPTGAAPRPSRKAIGTAADLGSLTSNPLPQGTVPLIGAATACMSTVILADMTGDVPRLAVLPSVILYLLCCASVLLAGRLAQRSARLASRRTMVEVLQHLRAPESSTIASTLAHELNQPLTAVSHYIEGCRTLLAKEAGPGNSKLDRALACASSEAIRAARIVGHLREFEAREDTLLAVEDLNDVVTHAVALLDQGAEQVGAAIVVDLGDVGTVYADRIQIEQVLVNLIRNGLEALHDCPTRKITVRTRRCGDEAQVIVEDSGSGLAPQLVDRLFKPIASRKTHGMGLGLSICRRIVEAHGGAIWAGEGESGGTAFAFTVSRCPEDANSATS